MKKNFFLIKIFIIYLFLISDGIGKPSNYLNEGILLFEKKEFNKSKIFFERDIVFNPKSEKSYLYLAKIFNKNDNDEEQEINLNNVLLINPINEEATSEDESVLEDSTPEDVTNLEEAPDDVTELVATTDKTAATADKKTSSLWLWVGIAVVVVLVLGIGFYVYK